MSHHHHHHHHHSPTEGMNLRKANKKAFIIGIGLNVIFVIIEIFYGIKSGSSALLADAGHNISDVLSLIFAFTAVWLAEKKPSGKYTYGLRRTTILVSMLNAMLLFGAVGFIGWDALQKLVDREPVESITMIWVAAIGILINGFTAYLFFKGSQSDLNIKGAFLHMAADAVVSLGVVISGVVIFYTGSYWIDPVISFVIMIVIIYSTWNLFIDSLDLALDAVPKNINLEAVRFFLQDQEGVEGVHDLHIWAMSTTETALTVHLLVPGGINDDFVSDIREKLYHNFKINHSTIQVEKATGTGVFGNQCN